MTNDPLPELPEAVRDTMERGRGGLPDFDAVYAGTPPWDVGRPQAAFLRLAESGTWRGRVLDVGCGTGEHTLLAASLGLQATGIDTAPTAIRLAEQKARQRGIEARFLVRNALYLDALGEQFDTVLDCGLFHLFNDEERSRFVAGLRGAITPGGRYYMMCFSDQMAGEYGPRRIRQDEIRATFANGWRIVSIEPATLETTLGPAGVPAWLAVIERA